MLSQGIIEVGKGIGWERERVVESLRWVNGARQLVKAI